MVVIAVVLLAAGMFIARTVERQLVDQIDAQLGRARLTLEPDGRGRGGADERLSSLYVGAFDRVSGQLVTIASANLRGDTPLPPPQVSFEQAVRVAESGTPSTIDGYRVLVRSGRFGPLVFALPLGDVDDAVGRLVAVEVGAGLIALAVLTLVAWWVIRHGIRPIKKMTETASAIAAGELSRRVADGATGTEAGELGQALNQMLSRIEESFADRARSEERLRQFVADASHELRTPITTIRGYAELYRSGGLDLKSDLDEALRRTEQEAVRMGSLVEDLLNLARLDQGRPLEREPVDLARLARDAVSDARAVDPERPIAVNADAPLVVRGDESRLRQVLANLVTNALVHTEPAVAVTVRVEREGDTAVLEVADRGAGMTPAVAARVFERFYRSDPSRSRHRGGSGLGLAIVDATVRAHGGSVELRTEPGNGSTVRVVLPL